MGSDKELSFSGLRKVNLAKLGPAESKETKPLEKDRHPSESAKMRRIDDRQRRGVWEDGTWSWK